MALTTDPYLKLKLQIIQIAKRSIDQFYAEHPDWFNDPRSKANVDSRYKCVRDILALLKDYDIRCK